jgi:hypothetical protein
MRWKSTDHSEQHVASIFRVEEKAAEETTTGLHGVTSQKTEFFTTTGVTTSNPTTLPLEQPIRYNYWVSGHYPQPCSFLFNTTFRRLIMSPSSGKSLLSRARLYRWTPTQDTICTTRLSTADPVRVRGGPQRCETSRLQHSLDNGLGEVVSLTRQPQISR